MSDIQNILVATDFSERAERAEKRAAMLCTGHKCNTTELMTVKEPVQLEGFARLMNKSPEAANTEITHAVLRELQARTSGLSDECGVKFTCTVRFGQPALEISARSEEISADLIVIGAHGSNFFTDIFLGNTADKLIRRCRRPLLVVKNEPAFPYRNILVPVDFSDDSRQAAQLALQIEPQAEITFLHAYDVMFASKLSYAGVSQDAIDRYRIKTHQEALLALNKFIDDLDTPRRHIMRDVVLGHPSAIVRDYAEKRQTDLIVIGKHGRSRIEELIVGSVTRDTIHWTKCDIMVVPPLAP